MKPRLWQALLFVGIALGLARLLLGHTDRFAVGSSGFIVRAVDGAPDVRLRVVTVFEGGAAEGVLRPGDVIEYPGNDFAERSLQGLYPPDTPLPLLVTRDGKTRAVTLVTRPDRLNTPLGMTWTIIFGSFYIIGGLLAVRCAGDPRARALANFLVALPLGVFDTTGTKAIALALLHDLANPLFVTIATNQLLRFATIFPEPATRGVRKLLQRANAPLTVALAATSLVDFVSFDVLGRTPPAWVSGSPNAFFVLFFACICTAFVVATREARGIERQRSLWVALAVGVGSTGVVVLVLAQAFGDFPQWMKYAPLTLVAIPVGMAYALLRHRLLDVGFVVNRALVFAGVSTVVVALFGTLEFVINRYLVQTSHVTSAIIELGVALALGLFLRPLHDRIDRFVDDVFFRERHRAEAAVRRCAHELAFITDLNVVLQRTVQTIATAMKAGSVTVLLAEAGGPYVPVAEYGDNTLPVDENDAALVSLRAFGTTLDLHGVETRLVGTHAFPLVVRGATIGVLACGRPPDVEPFAPDEVAAIESLAHALGVAIDVLRTDALAREVGRFLEGGGSYADLRQALEGLGGSRDTRVALPETGGAASAS